MHGSLPAALPASLEWATRFSSLRVDLPWILKAYLPVTLYVVFLWLLLLLLLLSRDVSLLTRREVPPCARALALWGLACMVLSPFFATVPLALAACALSFAAAWKAHCITPRWASLAIPSLFAAGTGSAALGVVLTMSDPIPPAQLLSGILSIP